MPRPLPRTTAVLALAILGISTDVRAQDQARDEVFNYDRPADRLGFDLQVVEPSSSPNSITTVDLGTVPGHLSLTAGLWTQYARNPLVVDVPSGTGRADTRALLGHLWQSELHASLGLFEYAEIAVALPVAFTEHAALAGDALAIEPYATASDVRLGDLRAALKVPLLRGTWPLALRLAATLPTGGHDAFAGNLSWTFTPAAIVSHAFGPVTAAANLGYRFRARNGLEGGDGFVLDDELVWGIGARYPFTRVWAINAEVLGRIGVSSGALQANRNPVEALLGATASVTDALSVQAGVGRGLSPGYGASEFRAYAGARYTFTRSQCAAGPEDFDGYQDGDYCADPDNDGDGVVDSADRCPNDAEDRDGFVDTDGCPDPDNDADEILDGADRCPVEPEDRDGFEDADGCPEGDNDRDGVPDTRDDCPMEPEDPDNYQDDDGCPEPGPEAVVVTRSESHLLLSQRVFFDYDSDTIRAVSLPILSEVAVTLRRNPDITRVRIEGYTDRAGTAQYNLDLSYRRARAVVEYLISQGIARDHLEYQGYGATHPVADDATPEGQSLNRRVEFTIVDQGGQAAEPSSAARARPPTRGRRTR